MSILPNDYKRALEIFRECFLNINGNNLMKLQKILEVFIFFIENSMDCFKKFEEFYNNKFKPLYREFKEECYVHIRENSDKYVLKGLNNGNKFYKHIGRKFYFNIEDIVLGERVYFYFDQENILNYIHITPVEEISIIFNTIEISTKNSIYIFEKYLNH